MIDISTALAKLALAPELDDYGSTVLESQIDLLQSFAEAILPDDYKLFLTRHGFAFWVGYAIYGIYDDADARFPKSYNFSAQTQTVRARLMHSANHYPFFLSSLVIGNDETGGYYLLVISEDLPDHSVVWVAFDDDWVVTEKWQSFAAYLYEAPM